MVLYPTNLLYKLLALWLNCKAELIDVVLQVLSRLAFVGTDATGLEHLRQFVGGDLIFITVLHGFCILAFMVMAGRIKDKQRG